MNAWGYIALVSIGIITGMIIHWYMVRDRIMNRKIVIGRNKQKNGAGNIQDLDIEMGESGSQKTIKEIRQERRQQRRIERQEKKEKRNK
jgi:hypothetical protein